MRSCANVRFSVAILSAWVAIAGCAKAPAEHPMAPAPPEEASPSAVAASTPTEAPEPSEGSVVVTDPATTDPEASTESPDEPIVNGPFSWKGDVLVLGEGDLVLDVALKREHSDTAWNEPFVPKAEAHVRVSLARNEHMADAPVHTIATWDVPASKVPSRVQWHADSAAVLGDGSEFLFFIDVYNHKGDEPRVGDLGSEYVNELTAKEKATVLLTGLELCGSPESGGYCTSVR